MVYTCFIHRSYIVARWFSNVFLMILVRYMNLLVWSLHSSLLISIWYPRILYEIFAPYQWLLTVFLKQKTTFIKVFAIIIIVFATVFHLFLHSYVVDLNISLF